MLGFNGSLFPGEIPGHDERLWHEITAPAFILGLAFLVSLQDATRAGHPAIGSDDVAIVLHGFGPIIHEVLINRVGIDERLTFGMSQKVLRKVSNNFLRQAINLDLAQAQCCGGAPLGKMSLQSGDKRGELWMAVDGGFQLRSLNQEIVVAEAVVFDQCSAEIGTDLPVIAERIQIAGGNAAVEMASDVLNIFGLLGVDIARQIQVVIVLLNLVMWHESGIAGMLLGIREHIDNLVQVTLPETILVAVFDEAFAGINHEDPFAGGRIFLIDHEDAGRNAGAVKEIGRETDDPFQKAGAHKLGANHRLGITTKQHPMRQNAGSFAGALQRANNVKQVSVVALLGGRLTPLETLERIGRRRKASAPALVGERRIRNDIIVSTELLTLLELGRGESVPGKDVRRRKIVQDHVHPGETGGGHVLFLALQRNMFPGFSGDLQQ